MCTHLDIRLTVGVSGDALVSRLHPVVNSPGFWTSPGIPLHRKSSLLYTQPSQQLQHKKRHYVDLNKKCLLNEYVLLFLFFYYSQIIFGKDPKRGEGARTPKSNKWIRGLLQESGWRRWQSRPLTFGNKHLSYSHCHCRERQSWEWKILSLELKYRILSSVKIYKTYADSFYPPSSVTVAYERWSVRSVSYETGYPYTSWGQGMMQNLRATK